MTLKELVKETLDPKSMPAQLQQVSGKLTNLQKLTNANIQNLTTDTAALQKLGVEADELDKMTANLKNAYLELTKQSIQINDANKKAQENQQTLANGNVTNGNVTNGNVTNGNVTNGNV